MGSPNMGLLALQVDSYCLFIITYTFIKTLFHRKNFIVFLFYWCILQKEVLYLSYDKFLGHQPVGFYQHTVDRLRRMDQIFLHNFVLLVHLVNRDIKKIHKLDNSTSIFKSNEYSPGPNGNNCFTFLLTMSTTISWTAYALWNKTVVLYIAFNTSSSIKALVIVTNV